MDGVRGGDVWMMFRWVWWGCYRREGAGRADRNWKPPPYNIFYHIRDGMEAKSDHNIYYGLSILQRFSKMLIVGISTFLAVFGIVRVIKFS